MAFTVTELSIKVYLLIDIPVVDVREEITRLIDNALAKDEKYLKFHKQNKYKNYVYDGLHPVEKEGVYHEGNIYTYRIRTIDDYLSSYLIKQLFTSYTETLKVLTVSSRVIPKHYLEKIFSITPIIIKDDNFGYWRGHLSLAEYEARLKINLIKNYNEFNNTKIDEGFELYTHFEFNNHKPVPVSFKNITLLGDKVTLYLSYSNLAQELAYFSLGTGVGENGSRGSGFLGYKYL
ncbi:MAG: CRISPR-associated endoribonuclease Cas6 [Lachnospiraceae bacterium]|nr:CRISPR-associated endoribonuclease Cas6 [Lachnospiraceae bacterium]